METMITLNIKEKLSVREVTNQYLNIPFARRVHMLDRLTKPKTISDHKTNLSSSVKFLIESELTMGDIGPIMIRIKELERELHKKVKKLRDETNNPRNNKANS